MCCYEEAKIAVDRILDKLGPMFMDRLCHDDALDVCWDYNFPREIEHSSGVTRLVLWDVTEPDYVVKIPLTMQMEPYCEREVELYQMACAHKIEDVFAWCDCIYLPDEIAPVGIYAMEYAPADEEAIESDAFEKSWMSYCSYKGISIDDDDKRDWYYETFEMDDADFISLVCNSAEDLDPYEVEDFCCDNTSDLHSGNIGFRYYTNQPVFIDYAGYGWL